MHFPLTESTPVHLAAGEGHEAVLEILLDKGGDVNSKDNNGSTPLHYAARGGCMAVVEALIQKGSDVKATEGVYGKELIDQWSHQSSTRVDPNLCTVTL
ncbi:putative ankyrin repeat protein RF_1087 [Penaeus monodon]|uniref:putative ankyrin repeat protein RF_1087 n=1 Tax=Penaeus monodon TaxID=6687 RepID=UPI0018A7D319|nr:putative ankyrin repeat protein RF_1087 [Penaeus monodon]